MRAEVEAGTAALGGRPGGHAGAAGRQGPARGARARRPGRGAAAGEGDPRSAASTCGRRPVDGMAAVTALLTMPEAQAAVPGAGGLRRRDRRRPGRSRAPAGRRWSTACSTWCCARGRPMLPPVQVLLTVVASIGTLAGGDEPGEIDGQVGARRDGPRAAPPLRRVGRPRGLPPRRPVPDAGEPAGRPEDVAADRWEQPAALALVGRGRASETSRGNWAARLERPVLDEERSGVSTMRATVGRPDGADRRRRRRRRATSEPRPSDAR